MSTLAESVLKIRPASLASMVARVCGLDKRRMVETDQGTFSVNPASYLGAALLRGTYEPQTTAILARFLPAGGVFLDLGANEGYFSVVASRLVGPGGTVIAVEPQSRLQPVIEANLAANSCSNVRLIRCVVSDKTGTMQLSLAPDTNTGSSSLFQMTKYSVPTEEVPSYSLPDLLASVGVRECDLAKIDIEGAEYDVFITSGDLLRSGAIRHIAVEIHDPILTRRGLSRSELHAHLLECGYELNRDVEQSDYPTVYSFAKKA